MKSASRIALFFAAAATVLSLAACGRHSGAEHYYLVATNTKLAYWQSAAAGLDKIASEYHIHADMRGPRDFDPQGEVDEFRSVVNLKPAGILVSVVDAKLMQPEIDNAINAGIPVVTIDSDAPNSRRLFFIGTNNRQAGRMGGQELIQEMAGRGGNVIFFTIAGQPNLDERLAGYEDVLSGTPSIHVADIIDIHGQSQVAFDQTEQLLAKTGKDRVAAFVCLEASAGKEIGEVFKRTNTHDRVAIAMDVDKDTLDLVKQGVLNATVAQKPYTMAYVGIRMLDNLHHDPLPSLTRDYDVDPFSPIPAFVDTGVSIVEKNNVDQYLQAEQKKPGT
jgi:ribose transport system substrate-binding protein